MNQLIETGPYVFYGQEYFGTVGILTILGIWIVRKASRSSGQASDRIQRVLAYVVSLTVILWTILEVIFNRFDINEDLPLIFCNLIALLLPIYTYYKRQWLFEVLYYLVLAGAINSVITPALDYSLPHYDTLKFWIVHAGLITFIFFGIFVEKRLPSLKGIVHSFIFVQAYTLLIVGIKFLLDANYLFLKEKPKTASLLDLLGDWPYYIFVLDVLLIPIFLILYLPVGIIKAIKKAS